jgi:cellulose synthase (UDP-forming)
MERIVPPNGERIEPVAANEAVNRENVNRETVPRETPVRDLTERETPIREDARTFAERPSGQMPEAERRVTPAQRRVLAFTWIGIFSMLIYALFMGLAFFAPGYRLVDRIASVGLLFGILFILMHGFGYANSMIKASWGYNEIRRRIFTPQSAPKVACVIATFNEPPAVVEETVAALVNVDYPNKEIVVLDDSTKEEARNAVREIAARYGVTVQQRTNRRGYKAGAINDFLKTTDAEYVAIFDADALPAHNFLRDVVPIILESPRLAFVQTPQHYANVDVSNVAMGASRQQSVFYEYICEGKSYSRSAFCCGTNVVFRRDALLDVGGFDEGSVTEDFSTSLDMHMKGWDSAYYNQIYVYSMAPETLPAYFTQQSRWAFGSVGAMRKVLGSMFTKGMKMRPGQWWEYFLSSTYYWIGWVNFIFMLLPLAYIFFGVQPLRQDVFTYLAIFIPYFIFTMNMFYAGMEDRGYRVTDMLLGQQVGFLCFPVHMSAALSGILGMKRPFGVTPKGTDGRASWLSLWPQILMLILSAVAFVWGMYKYIVGIDRNTAAIVINSLWAFYHTFLLSGIFRLNKPLTRTQSKSYFSERSTALAPDGTPLPAGAVPAGAAAATTTGQPVFGQTSGGGTIVAPPPRMPARTAPRGAFGRLALGIMVVSLVLIGATAWTMLHWAMTPSTPVNVYMVDRTTGRDYQEHRALAWTLNFLKLRKDPKFGPNPNGGNTNYNFANDFYGFIPGDPNTAVEDPTRQADLLVQGENVDLPERLETPGVVFLADGYGEFVEYDYNREKYIRYTNKARGFSPDEVDRIEDFSNRAGLVIGEWNTLGYPTLPAVETNVGAINAGIAQAQKSLQFLTTQELPQREAQLRRAQQVGDERWITTMEQQIAQTREGIRKNREALQRLQASRTQIASAEEQIQAQRRLEKVLNVDYLGWYGRYVDSFEQEREYDFRMWKNVTDYINDNPDLKRLYPDGPKGPGFVFYRDGPSEITNPETGKPEPNPFSRPVVLLQHELRQVNSTDVATINSNPQLANDPLLKDVAEQAPCRFWFDVVSAAPNTQVLAFYKLLIRQAGADRLRNEGFPAQYLKGTGDNQQIVFPAAIAGREGGANGQLRSFYFAGDASDYTLVSRFQEMVPASGGISYFLGHRTGPFPMQFYWNYYQPLLRNILLENPNIRHKS